MLTSGEGFMLPSAPLHEYLEVSKSNMRTNGEAPEPSQLRKEQRTHRLPCLDKSETQKHNPHHAAVM